MSIELIVAVALGLGLTKLVVSCLRHESPRALQHKAMLENYLELREGRLNRQDSFSRSEYTANRMLAK